MKATATIRKYAGLWIPVVVMENGKRISGVPCASSYGAQNIARSMADKINNG